MMDGSRPRKHRIVNIQHKVKKNTKKKLERGVRGR